MRARGTLSASLIRYMDCILIRPPFFHTGFDQDYQESLGIGYLAAALRQQGYSVGIIDGELQDLSPEEIAKMVLSLRPTLAGLSLVSAAALEGAAAIAEILEDQKKQEIHLTAGGHLASLFPREVAEEIPTLDSLVLFEGEVILPRLLESLLEDRAIDIPGIILTGTEFPEERKLRGAGGKNIDLLPFPARDILPAVTERGLPATILSSRGCSGSCTFCSAVSFCMRSCGIPLRQRSAPGVVAEMKELVHHHGVSVIHFIDDDFIGSIPEGLDRAREIARGIIRENLPVIFYLECRPDHIDTETFALLKEAGLAGIFLGIDSSLPATRRLYNKRCSMETVHASLETLRRLDIEAATGFIPFHPLTEFSDIKKEYDFLFEQNLDTPHTLLNRLYCTPRLPVTETFRKKGLITNEDAFESYWDFLDEKTALYYQLASTVIKPIFPAWYGLYRQARNERDRALLNNDRGKGPAPRALAHVNKKVRETVKGLFHFVEVEDDRDLLDFAREQRAALQKNIKKAKGEVDNA